MKNAKLIYNVLLRFYPHRYRKAFGAQMMQTFSDHYQDVETSERRVSLTFWLSIITDEIKNITRQHRISLLEENNFLKVTVSKLVISAILLVPLYAVFYSALVKVLLALPHPHVSGFGVLMALATLLLLPALFSVVVSYVFSSICAWVISNREIRIA